MKIAIACSGLGNVRRGFETFAEDLFRNLESMDEIEVTLYKGGGPAATREIPLWNISRSSAIWHLSGQRIDPYIGEQLTFSLAFARRLKKESFDIVHLSDGQLGSSLLRLFPVEARKFRIVFSNGGPLSPYHYRRFDLIHQVNPTELDRALAHGVPNSRMTLLPYGVSVDSFHRESREETRSSLGIPESVPVLLTVGAHGTHKRLDFLIRQLAAMDDGPHLVIVGEEAPHETPELRRLASHLLGEKVNFLSLPHEAMPFVYTSADIYVHCSLREGFGLTLLEAMAAGLPIVHHNESVMNWLVGDAGVGVDMLNGEQLRMTLNTLLADSGLWGQLAEKARKRARVRFSWEVLLPRYAKMYERALSLPLNV